MVLQILIVVVRGEHTGNDVATQLHTRMCNQTQNFKGFSYAFVRHIYVNKMNVNYLTRIDPMIWRWKKKTDH
ncbi:unnamed protein product [Adineta steineri]|uniref:Uncharacterized protein n=1 Tax=Adineta steineri TaxID=433720 RepID=A0A815ICF6_9BILA|nr:unnamed protein product [Adineta steineri]